jgi:hypothetical protein
MMRESIIELTLKAMRPGKLALMLPAPGGVKLVNQAFIDYIEQVYQF